MADSVSAVANSAATQAQTSIKSIQDLQDNPEFFPLWVEEIQRRNLNLLLSSTSSGSDTEDASNSLLGSYYSSSTTGSSTDLLSALGLSSASTDPLSSLFSTQGVSADFSFLSSTASLQSYQVAETLQGLQNYSNATEAKKWLGQLVEYIDPADKLLKTGRVTKIDIENVYKPIFRVDDQLDITLDDIKALASDAADAATTGQQPA